MDIEAIVKKHGSGVFVMEKVLRAALTEQAAGYEQRIRELEAQKVPEGWKLVPKQITTEMADAYWRAYEVSGDSHLGVCWAAVLAAAPKKEGECVHRFMYFGDQPNRRCADCNAIEGAAP